ncbi:acid protease [Diplodia corticola]|uniref:Acid protease n=1 Tax=Diplodia corticola TaxID=236234 RepID=A0A1J9QZ58_9PEZI|nr:acid protease [Diplodia corticola]OJD34366.1 acid protease [Diplodia corticola]
MSFLRRRADAVSAPYTVPNTGQWDGNDGSWSTFRLSVGTPAQEFRVLVSTRGHETWVPAPDGCTADDPSDCASSRGAENSVGFQTNKSSTWESVGTYTLGLEDDLGLSGDGLYGYDSVRLGSSSDDAALQMDHQLVAGVADKEFYMGVLGLSPVSSSLDSTSDPVTSLLDNLKTNNSIPSLSYAYTAGAYYRNDKVPGSLLLGGYDQARFNSPPTFNFSFADGDTSNLMVGVQSITASNSLIGVAAMTHTGHLSLIDSTVPELWLPEDVCDTFANNFGLTYDNTTDLYLVNDTIHSRLTDLNPEFTIKLGDQIYTSESNSTNIVLPYSAFDLEISAPVYSNATRYFPIRRAANDSQYRLGRTLLQEAYLVVDHERRNFTVAQAKFSDPLPAADVVTIRSPDDDETDGTFGSSTGLSTGATAGIAVAASVVGVFLIVAIIFCWRRRSKRKGAEQKANEALQLQEQQLLQLQQQQQQQQQGEAAKWHGFFPAEVDSGQISEMQASKHDHIRGRTELDPGKDNAYELAAAHVPMVYEMEANDPARRHEAPNDPRFSWQR